MQDHRMRKYYTQRYRYVPNTVLYTYITMLRKFSTLFWRKHLLREFIDMNNTPKTKPMPNYSKTDPIESNNMVLTRHTRSVTLAIFKESAHTVRRLNGRFCAIHNPSPRLSYTAHFHCRQQCE